MTAVPKSNPQIPENEVIRKSFSTLRDAAVGMISYALKHTQEFAESLNQKTIFANTLLTQELADRRKLVMDQQKTELDPIMARINELNKLSKQRKLSEQEGQELTTLQTKYNEVSVRYQQGLQVLGTMQDSVTDTFKSVSTSIETFISFLAKLVDILDVYHK